MKTALITGINGQDGSYLSKLLINHNYKVIGTVRDNSSNRFNLKYLGIDDSVVLEVCDFQDYERVAEIFNKYKPEEVYNLAAQSSVGASFNEPKNTFQVNTTILLNILEVIRNLSPNTKLYQASSSEMFGNVRDLPICGDEKYNPLSPYAVSKVASHLLAKNYRNSYGLYIATGILFNHESYLRKDSFFLKKVIKQSIKIMKGKQELLEVGNIDVRRDFGYAPKYVEAMYLMLQQNKAEDYIVCSGESVSLRELIYYVFESLNISKKKLVIKDDLFRPLDIPEMVGDNSRTKEQLGWEYNMTVWDMMDLLIQEELDNSNN